MADTLGARVGRIVSGSAHALIDTIEGAMPDAIVQQTLREIDKAVDDVRAELGRTIAGKHLANKRLTEQSSRHEELAGQIELALRESREDLARAAVEHQLDVEAQVPVLEATVADAGKRDGNGGSNTAPACGATARSFGQITVCHAEVSPVPLHPVGR